MTGPLFKIDIRMPALTPAQRDDMRRHVAQCIEKTNDSAGEAVVEVLLKIGFISTFIATFHYQSWFSLFDTKMIGTLASHGLIAFLCLVATTIYHTRFFDRSATESDRKFGITSIFLIFWLLAQPEGTFGMWPGDIFPETTVLGWIIYAYSIYFTSSLGFDVVNMFPVIAEELERLDLLTEDLSDSAYTAEELLEDVEELDEIAIRYLGEVVLQGRTLIELEVDELLDER